jgi:hypothetical protein
MRPPTAAAEGIDEFGELYMLDAAVTISFALLDACDN